MDYKKIIFYLFIFSFISCNFSNKKTKSKIVIKNINTDIFYTENEGLDYIRFPLLKPFDATSGARVSWLLGIGHDTEIYADNICELTIFEKNIFIHSIGDTIVGDDSVQEGWYVVNFSDKKIVKDVTDKKEFLKDFKTKKEFLQYLKSININSEKLDWKKPADLYKQFKETGCLPWIPNC